MCGGLIQRAVSLMWIRLRIKLTRKAADTGKEHEMNTDLHQRLVDMQPTAELRRKQRRSVTKHHWTQEDLDLADREGRELHDALFGGHDAQELE